MNAETAFSWLYGVVLFFMGVFVKRNDKRLDVVEEQQRQITQALSDFRVEVEKSKTAIEKELGNFKTEIVKAIYATKQ